MRSLVLQEYVPLELAQGELTEAEAELIWSRLRGQVEIEPPSFKTNGRWRLRSLGWVGQAVVHPELQLLLLPKAPVTSLFAMIECAYGLEDIAFGEEAAHLESAHDLFAALALLLARKTSERARRGLYLQYEERSEEASYVRGRPDWPALARRPVRSKLPCMFEVHEADNDDNRILLWTLHVVGRSGLVGDEKASLASAYRALANCVSLAPFAPRDCAGRTYSRLNGDYSPLHGLCRLLLSGSAPVSAEGDLAVPPFLLDMATLFEVFVYQWLRLHLPEGLDLEQQERIVVDEASGMEFRIDLVVRDQAGKALCTLDTKYKRASTADTGDVHQAVAYAVSVGAGKSVLVYPSDVWPALDVSVGDVHVSAVSFDLGTACVDEGGRSLLDALLHLLPEAPLRPGTGPS